MTDNKLLTSALQTLGPKLFSRISQSEMCEALGLLDQKQLAARLGLSYEAFRWRVSKGRLPKPAVKLMRRAYYTADQVDALEMREAHSNNSAAKNKEENNGSSKR
ncbi:helix-turn-helix transcriptional regulator [Thalassoroseus pseudoceratinae]|uniref:helix-turn-helix transcriptional regulator n=1 Tax=Thalassoroseus pseudoceratinae TaxID=2713176 RepID=UPI0014227963|nr:hypothetical protein [Thalassoroseus pseudoceratinae]